MRVGLVLLMAAVPAFSASADDYITIRATPALPSEAIEYIASNSEPKSVFIPARELPSNFIKAVCGTYTKTFGAIFFGIMNPALSSEPAELNRRVSLPACAKWRRDDSGNGLPYGVSPGETLDSILLRKIGRKANQTYKCGADDSSPNCGRTYRELVEKLSRGIDLTNLIPGQIIRLPFATDATTFQIRRSSPLDVKAHIAKIQELSKFSEPDSPLIQIEEAPIVSMIKPLSQDDADSGCPGDRQRPPTWPYDGQLVASVIRRTLSQVQQPNPSTLTVIDTGIDASFPASLLRRNDGVDARYAYGIGIFRTDNIRPYPDQMPEDVRMHGTRVARIAVGFPSLQRVYPEISQLFKLNVVNIAEPPSVTGGDYGISLGGLAKATEWFTSNGDIVNISIASKAELASLQTAMKLHPQLLVVVAAGNESDELQTSPWYPANYGGKNEESGTQFVTVAAYSGSLARATFTNVSSIYVDLFAPGCDVPYDQATTGATGTSFAAPLVSMTAALLRSFGLKAPKEIKRRLRASVDYDKNLTALAAWSGRLNIPKALSIYDDVLQLHSKGGTLEFGRWDVPNDICKIVPLPSDKIRKITVSKAENPVEIRVLWSDSQEQLQEELCEPTTDSLALGGRTDPIPWTDLNDFVPRRPR